MSEDAWKVAQEATAPQPSLSPDIGKALLDWLQVDGQGDYEKDRLHIGADLSPDTCERKTWYGIHNALRDPPKLGDQLRFKGGRLFEEAIVAALKHAGHEVKTQVLVRPIRPSAWAWSPGHADVLLVDRKHLLEVKAPRSMHFARSKGDPKKLVKVAYRHQLSAYFHELKRRGIAETASWLFLDREGSNEPVEVPLEGELLIPLSEIVALEEKKAYLITAKEPPPRIDGSLQVKVWKGPRAKKGQAPERRVEAVQKRNWQCGWCSFTGVCQPGPEESTTELSAAHRSEALAVAETRWKEGSKSTPQVVRFGNDNEDIEEAVAETVSEEATSLAEASSSPRPGDDGFEVAVVKDGKLVPADSVPVTEDLSGGW